MHSSGLHKLRMISPTGRPHDDIWQMSLTSPLQQFTETRRTDVIGSQQEMTLTPAITVCVRQCFKHCPNSFNLPSIPLKTSLSPLYRWGLRLSNFSKVKKLVKEDSGSLTSEPPFLTTRMYLPTILSDNYNPDPTDTESGYSGQSLLYS